MDIYSKDTIAKIGNSMVYLASSIPDLNKTKLIKLLYLLEECSVKKHGTPFFSVNFQIWKLGPVAKNVFIDLSNDSPELFKDYIELKKQQASTKIVAKSAFDDDEFSDNDMDILEYVLTKFGKMSAKDLVKYTHNNQSAWNKQARENGLIELFDSNVTNSSDVNIDFSHYLSACVAARYKDTLESKRIFESFK